MLFRVFCCGKEVTFNLDLMVINNFVIKIDSQIKDSLCRVFGDGVQYEWRENDDKVMIPDVSII